MTLVRLGVECNDIGPLGRTGDRTAPPPGIQINWADPIVQKMVLCAPLADGDGSLAANLCGTGQGTWQGTSTRRYGPGLLGRSGTFVKANVDRVSFPVSIGNQVTGGITVATWIKYDPAITGGQNLCGNEYAGQRGWQFLIVSRSSDGAFYIALFSSQAGARQTPNSGYLPYQPYMLVAASATFGAGGVKYFVNGRQVASTGTSLLQPTAATYPLYLGVWPQNMSDFQLNGAMANAMVWSRALSTAEHERLYRDPYCWVLRAPDEMQFDWDFHIPSKMHHYRQTRTA